MSEAHDKWGGSASTALGLGCRPGSLNGTKILRFAHAFRNSGGGVEQYLHNLNTALLQRNSMTIIQMYLAREGDSCEIETEDIGEGRLVWVPSILKQYKKQDLCGAKAALKNLVLKCLGREGDNPDRYRFVVQNDKLLEAFATFKIDLAIFHWVSVDSQEVFRRAIQVEVPYVIMNHFDNQRFKLNSVKKWVKHAALCGGVSNVGVPSYLDGRFVNVSDGIDTGFFSPDNARPLPAGVSDPVVFMPSRIAPLKGHLDLVQAVLLLKSAGMRAKVAFAGREDSLFVAQELRSFVARMGMEDDVLFLGQLGPPELRDWYGASAVVVLPSYSEGLGRILLEAQAMEKPVVAYDTGGVPEALKDGVSGYLVPKGDFRAFAGRLGELISCHEKRREMGKCGKDFVTDRFSPVSLAVRHEHLYLSALSR